MVPLHALGTIDKMICDITGHNVPLIAFGALVREPPSLFELSLIVIKTRTEESRHIGTTEDLHRTLLADLQCFYTDERVPPAPGAPCTVGGDS